MTMRNVHIVSHTHWDREWYRTFQEFRLKLVKLVDGLLDLLERDNHFKYFLLDGQTIVLDDYLAIRPEKESEIRELVKKGRLIIGPWHILPDMFLVGPESHIRNLLQGDQTARNFGQKMMIGYIPDPFGYPGQVPQILQGFNITTACLWRGLDEQPLEFLWQSPDGSQVLMAYLRESYSNGASLPADDLQGFSKGVTDAVNLLAPYSDTQEILIMYGTDHMEPPKNTSAAISRADKHLKDMHVFHSTLPQYISAVQNSIKKNKVNLPVVEGELRACKRMHLLPGVSSTRMWIKQRNAACENLLTRWAEPFSVFEEYINGKNQGKYLQNKSEIIQNTWRLLMENHPHDSICGCSIDQVHDEMKVRFDQVDQMGEEIIGQSLISLAETINTQSPDPRSAGAIVVFNPSSQKRTNLISATLKLPPHLSDFDIVDGSGNSLPYQTTGLGSREIINAVFTQNELRTTFGYIQDGRAAGMTIQDIKINKNGDQVFIETIMAEGGEPNINSWQAGLNLIEQYFKDPEIVAYNVKARFNETIELKTIARDVPGLGYKTYWLKKRDGENKKPIRFSPLMKFLLPLAKIPLIQKVFSGKKQKSTKNRIENEYFIVEPAQDGTISVFDKKNNVSYQGLNRFVDGGDCGDEYNYCPPERDVKSSTRLIRKTISDGRVQKSICLEMEMKTPAMLNLDRKSRSSKLVTIPISCTISLTSGVPRIDIKTHIDNKARDHRLMVHFPAPFQTNTAYHDGHFEVVERKIGIPPFDATWIEQPRPEVPQRAFTDISDKVAGLMIANRGLPEVEVLKNSSGNSEVALTLLRCVGWLSRDDFSTRKGHAGPVYETPGAQVQGLSTFEYSIIPHTGSWENAYQLAYDFTTPMRSVSAEISGGTLPPEAAFIQVEPKEFVVTTIKQSQDGRGWVIRGYNPLHREITLSVKPWKHFSKVEKVNLAEERINYLKSDKEGKVITRVGSNKIESLLFQD